MTGNQQPSFVVSSLCVVPTPGQSLQLDGVEAGEPGRVIARFTATSADGGGKESAPSPVSIELGGAVKGHQTVEVHLRHGSGEKHILCATLVVTSQIIKDPFPIIEDSD